MAFLPEQTSRYNVGRAGSRYRDARGDVRYFERLRASPVFDGGGRELARVREPVALNSGTKKKMDLDPPDGRVETYAWGWGMRREDGGRISAWIRRMNLNDPPRVVIDPDLNPRPP